MTKYVGQNRAMAWTILFLCLCPTISEAVTDSLVSNYINAANKIRLENPDSAIQELKSTYSKLILQEDTLHAIWTLTNLSMVYGNMGNYSKSYNALWDALLLAERANKPTVKVFVYQRIGRFYSFYKRKEQALHYMDKGLALNKELVQNGKLERATLTQRYFAYCSTYLELGEPEVAQIYLDSCLMHYQKGIKGSLRLPFIRMQQAFIDIAMNRSDQAILAIQELTPWFKIQLPTYMVLVNTYLGDAYLKIGDEVTGEQCYQKAIRV